MLSDNINLLFFLSKHRFTIPTPTALSTPVLTNLKSKNRYVNKRHNPAYIKIKDTNHQSICASMPSTQWARRLYIDGRAKLSTVFVGNSRSLWGWVSYFSSGIWSSDEWYIYEFYFYNVALHSTPYIILLYGVVWVDMGCALAVLCALIVTWSVHISSGRFVNQQLASVVRHSVLYHLIIPLYTTIPKQHGRRRRARQGWKASSRQKTGKMQLQFLDSACDAEMTREGTRCANWTLIVGN